MTPGHQPAPRRKAKKDWHPETARKLNEWYSGKADCYDIHYDNLGIAEQIQVFDYHGRTLGYVEVREA